MFELPFTSLRSKIPGQKTLYFLFFFILLLAIIKSMDLSKLLSFIMISFCVSIYLHFSNLLKKSRIHLFHNQNFQSKNVSLEKLTYLKDAHFHPTPYLSHPILQALYNHKTSIFESDKIHVNFHREYIRLPDCGQVSLDASFLNHSSKKLLIIMHGLTGGSDTPYVRALVQEAHKQGFMFWFFIIGVSTKRF